MMNFLLICQRIRGQLIGVHGTLSYREVWRHLICLLPKQSGQNSTSHKVFFCRGPRCKAKIIASLSIYLVLSYGRVWYEFLRVNFQNLTLLYLWKMAAMRSFQKSSVTIKIPQHQKELERAFAFFWGRSSTYLFLSIHYTIHGQSDYVFIRYDLLPK